MESFNDSSVSLAPKRRASLHPAQRPATSYISNRGLQERRDEPFGRPSFVPDSSLDTSDCESLEEQKEFSSGITNLSDPFTSYHYAATLPTETRPISRRPSLLRQGWSELRSIGRRVSVSVKNKTPKQKEEHTEHSRRPPLTPFKSEPRLLNLEEALSTRPKSRGWLARSPAVSRRPSLPLLNFETVPPYIQPSQEPITLQQSDRTSFATFLHGGAGARASAAAQNELYHAARGTTHAQWPTEEKVMSDSESGIGISLGSLSRRNSAVEGKESYFTHFDPHSVLPAEVMENVLGFLDVTSLHNASLVSQRWHSTCQSQTIWRDVFYREYGHSFTAKHRGVFANAGMGKSRSGQNYRKLYKVRKQISQRWDQGQAAAIYLNGHKDSVYCVQFDEKKIITGSRDNTIRVWDAHTYECVRKLGAPHNSRESLQLARHPVAPRGRLPICSLEMATADKATDYRSEWHDASILCLQYDDEILVTGSSDFTCIVWSIKDDYKPLFRLVGHLAGVLDVCIDKERIITCSKDTTIRVWDRFSGRLIKTLYGHRGPVNAVQVRGNLLASASGDGMSKLWRLEDGVCIKGFQSKDRGLACVEFSEDGRTIFAGGNDKVVYEYDTVTGRRIRELRGHENLVRSLHLDSANSRIISGSYDHSIKVWDANSGESSQMSFEGWSSSWMLAAKSDYRKIVCTSQDGRVVIMDFGYGVDGVELVEG